MNGDAEAVLAANREFYRAFAARDMAAMERLWSRGGPVACIHPGWDALGERDAILASWRRILENPAAPAIACRNAIPFLRGDSAFVICHEVMPEGVLVATNIFAREAEGWKMVHHQATPMALMQPETPPPPETRH